MRDEGTTLSGAEIADPPRYLIAVADMPLADPYDPQRLEDKLDAGADVVMTQIAYDVEALTAWADLDARARAVRTREGHRRRRAAPQREGRRGSCTSVCPASACPRS